MYHYAAKLIRVIDGDTIAVELDLGFDTFNKIKIRMKGINAPELSTPAGIEAKAFLEKLLDGKSLEVETSKASPHDKYAGRWNATVWASELGKSQVNVNLAMVDSGQAVKYTA